jgi:hypothetical protein
MRRTGISPAGAFELQTSVLGKILRLERRIRNLRSLVAANRIRMAGTSGSRLSKADALVLKTRIARHRGGIDRCRRALALTRSITDGLAFSVLPKWDIKPLSFKETAGFVSGKAGLSLERLVLRALAKKGEVAIMNDLTNCLRYGDVTVPRHPAPLILEVKSGSTDNPRTRRQLATAQEVAEYLAKDVSANWQGTGWTVNRRPVEHAERDHRRRLVRLIERARESGHAVSWPEPGVCYCCFGRSPVHEVIERLRHRFKETPMAYPLFPAERLPSYYYPRTLSIRDSHAWWDIVSGELSLVVLIDPARVKALGRTQGLVVAQLDDPEWLWTVTADGAKTDLRSFRVSRQFFGRIAGEFLSLRWFVDETASRFRHGPLADRFSDGTEHGRS